MDSNKNIPSISSLVSSLGLSREINNGNSNDIPQTSDIQTKHFLTETNSSNNVTNNCDNYPTPTSISPEPDHQQYNPSNDNPPSQSTFNDISNNEDTNAQFYSQYIKNSPQPNFFPLLNSLRININSPQTNIIIMPVSNSDIKNQP
ncbi:hypothetical protein C1646_760491 [Rhizophagus diaphanus]|nr:hypothetical protein C1646_760491 [Rhizophagus diaphanus] [Rhizophagus sp. MUCL 43196]